VSPGFPEEAAERTLQKAVLTLHSLLRAQAEAYSDGRCCRRTWPGGTRSRLCRLGDVVPVRLAPSRRDSLYVGPRILAIDSDLL
jgi:hypothetical protein